MGFAQNPPAYWWDVWSLGKALEPITDVHFQTILPITCGMFGLSTIRTVIKRTVSVFGNPTFFSIIGSPNWSSIPVLAGA